MPRYLSFTIVLFLSSTCLSQQKILLIGTLHHTEKDRVGETAPIAKAVENFNPGIICVEYPVPTDSASLIRKSVIMRGTAKVFELMDSTRREWKLSDDGMTTRIKSLQRDPDLPSDIKKRMELQQLYYVSFDYGNADYQGYQILTTPGVEPQETSLRENSPGFEIMKQIYQHQRWRNNEYYLLVFPLAVKLNISYLHPIDDLSTWGEYEKHFDRLQVPDTTDVSKSRNRQMVKGFLDKIQSLPKGTSEWLFVNSPATIRELLHVESYIVDEDINNTNIKMLQYYWILRNRTIARNIDAVAHKHPDTNIVVFFGASHVGPVQEELNKLPKDYHVMTLFDVMK